MKGKCAHPHLCKAEELGTMSACRQGKKKLKKNKKKEEKKDQGKKWRKISSRNKTCK